jgi:hypothetical protein
MIGLQLGYILALALILNQLYNNKDTHLFCIQSPNRVPRFGEGVLEKKWKKKGKKKNVFLFSEKHENRSGSMHSRSRLQTNARGRGTGVKGV